MHVEIVPNRGSKPTILLRESYREGKKVRKRTIGNISKLPMEQVEAIRRVLRGEQFICPEEAFEIVEDGSPAHGHVEAVITAMRRLGFERLINSRSSRQRSLVVAMVAARILKPQSKIATTRWWSGTTLSEMLGVSDADEDELYETMDWLLERQGYIEKKLADRHLKAGGLALYDLTSSYFEGVTCPLAARGHNRDKKKGKLQVNYGLLTSDQGIPVSISVFKGNSGDPKTLLPQVDTMRDDFDIEEFVLVGDRGMITQKQVDALRDIDGVDWVGALRPGAIKKLIKAGSIQTGLFDEGNLFELVHPDFPGERLVACRNPDLAVRRATKRKELLEATVRELEKVRQMVHGGRLYGKELIAARIRKVLGQYKVGKYYTIELRDNGFDYKIDRNALAADVVAKSHGQSELADKRLARCNRHIGSISEKLEKIRRRTEQGRLHGKAEIGVRVGKVIDKYKMSKHFNRYIGDDSFDFEIDQQKVDTEAALDGIYIVRTSVKKRDDGRGPSRP